MFDFLGTGLFALIVLSTWTNQDVKTGYIHNVSLVVPVLLAVVLYTQRFIVIFMPVFLLFFAVYVALHKLKRPGLFGFADVVGLPFTLLFLADIGVFGLIAFTIVIAVLVLRVSDEKYDEKLKRKVYNRIPLMPVLLLSYFAGFLVHLIFLLIS
jgi:hypothetical protein